MTSPNSMPKADANPARLPWDSERADTYSTPGPGAAVMIRVATPNSKSVVRVGIAGSTRSNEPDIPRTGVAGAFSIRNIGSAISTRRHREVVAVRQPEPGRRDVRVTRHEARDLSGRTEGGAAVGALPEKEVP